MNNANEIKAYLLGSLPPEHVGQIEQQILTDNAFHEEIEIMEEELTDEYVQGKMVREDRLLFERNFLASPSRKQKLTFARALQTKIDSRDNNPAPSAARFSAIYPYALAACALVMIALVSVSYHLSAQLQEQRRRTALLNQQIKQLEETRNANFSGTSSADLFSQPLVVAKLIPGVSRGGNLPIIHMPDGIRAVQFALQVPKPIAGGVSVNLLDDSGSAIFGVSQVQTQRIGNEDVAIVTVIRERLKAGNYFLLINSAESPPTQLRYSFQLTQ
jgi:hypothetical protein